MSSCAYIYSTCCICSYSCINIVLLWRTFDMLFVCSFMSSMNKPAKHKRFAFPSWKMVWIVEDTLIAAASAVETEVTNSSTVWKLCSPRGPSNGIRISLYHFFWSLAHSGSYTWPGHSTQPNCRSAITCPWTCQQRTCYVERLQTAPLSPFAPCRSLVTWFWGNVNLKPEWKNLDFSFKVARQP